MKKILFYYLRTYFGFSARESRGFVLVVPSLFLLYLVPSIYEWSLKRKNRDLYAQYELKIDSLITTGRIPLRFGEEKLESVNDTVKRPAFVSRPRNPGFNKIDFNEADSVVLQIVPGIGQTMASRIVKFRESIGGLHQKEQLLDVYGMTPELVEKLFDHFEFSPGIIRMIPINQISVQDLAKHPYISYGAAKVIIAFREQHGVYRQPDDLLQIKILNQEWVDRLAPYLEFEN